MWVIPHRAATTWTFHPWLTNNRNSGGTAVAGGLIKTGAGAMMLSGANTFPERDDFQRYLKAGVTTAA